MTPFDSSSAVCGRPVRDAPRRAGRSAPGAGENPVGDRDHGLIGARRERAGVVLRARSRAVEDHRARALGTVQRDQHPAVGEPGQIGRDRGDHPMRRPSTSRGVRAWKLPRRSSSAGSRARSSPPGTDATVTSPTWRRRRAGPAGMPRRSALVAAWARISPVGPGMVSGGGVGATAAGGVESSAGVGGGHGERRATRDQQAARRPRPRRPCASDGGGGGAGAPSRGSARRRRRAARGRGRR